MRDSQVVFFVGKPFNSFAKWLVEQGYSVGVFIDQHKNRKINPDIYRFIVEVDYTSEETILNSISKLPFKPDYLIAIYENYIIPKVIISQELGFPSLTLESARKATDKYLMRQSFLEYDSSITPLFAQVKTKEELLAFTKQTSFPLIIKPANLFKSLLVTKNDNLEELLHNWEVGQETIRNIYQKEGVSKDPAFVVEEFMSGPVVSVEAFADYDGQVVVAPNVVDLVMGRDIGVSDNYNYSRKLPSHLSESTQQAIHKVAIKGVKALKLTSSPAHVEIILTSDGPKIIEIGARTGGYRPRMYELALGTDLYQAQLDVVVGRLPKLTKQKTTYCAVYELFPESKGKFSHLSRLKQLSELPSLVHLSVKRKLGEKIGLSKDGFRAVAVIILSTTNKQQFEKDTSFIEKEVKVKCL